MITIIINVYNGEKHIKKCLDSIVNQTYKDLEILIINDGSTDNTLSICKSYKDKRIRIITKKSKNISLSRNIGLDNAKGEYIYFIDSDDYIDLDTIEYLYNLCKKYNTDIATCRCVDVYNYDYKKKEIKEKTKVITSEEILKKILLSTNREVAIWNKLIKRELIKDLRLYDRIITDTLYTYRLMFKTDEVAYSNQVKYYYFNHKKSYSHSKNENLERTIDMYNAYNERYLDVKKKYPNMIENNASILWLIPRKYLCKNKEITKFLDERNAKKLYKELFTLKVLKCDIGFKEKLKLILFRISPRLHNFVMNKYIKVVVDKK